jgi:thioredoxin 2
MSVGAIVRNAKIEVRCGSCGRVNAVPVKRADQQPSCGACHVPLALAEPISLTDATFGELLNQVTLPVLVDFWAPWCGPCRVMGPILEQFAKTKAGQVLVAKVDTQENQAVAASLGIQNIPTLILFRKGKEIRRQVGLVPELQLEQMLRA